MAWRCHDISSFNFYFFVFRTNGKKEHLDENNFCDGYSNFYESAAVKVSHLMIAMFKVFFSTIRRHIDHGIWETFYSRRFYGNVSTYVLILPWLTIMQTSWLKCLGNYQLHKNLRLYFEEHITKIKHDISLIIVWFFFSRTNLVFKFNLVLIKKLSPQFIFILPFYSMYLEVYPVPLPFVRSSKI